MIKTILVLEDDPLQAETFCDELGGWFRGVKVEHLESESEFRDWVEEKIVKGGQPLPDVVVADVMMPWAFPSPEAPLPPEDVRQGGLSRAGVRCLMYFRERVPGDVPWVLFSILDQEHIRKEIESVKGAAVVSK